MAKTDNGWLQTGINEYLNRLQHYIKTERIELTPPKATSNTDDQKRKETELFLSKIEPSDTVFLLDARGKMLSSEELASFLQEQMLTSSKRLVLIVGGAYGFGDAIYQRANGLLSFSKMTFSHQMIRLLLCEQLYRACTILKGEKYHH